MHALSDENTKPFETCARFWLLRPEAWLAATQELASPDPNLRAAALHALVCLDDGLSPGRSEVVAGAVATALYDPDSRVVESALASLFDWRMERGRPHYHPEALAIDILGREFGDLDSADFLSTTAPRQTMVIEWSRPTKADFVSAPRKALNYLGGAFSMNDLLNRLQADGGRHNTRAARRWALESLVFHFGYGWATKDGVRAALEKALESANQETRQLAWAGLALLPAR